MAPHPHFPRPPIPPQTRTLHSQMGLRQFPPARQKPQEIRVVGPNHWPHRRHRQGLHLSALSKRAQFDSSRAKP
ncbi:very-long-chain 3-oxoacyl-coa reductase 1 [Phtheirospermum japonicum]|uniref:Very-long-chain 3-oxoacyl-coa reductase 1 n=1 Tax=Phtheirospermum japonicum TaxID=374723 RepID=A0A830BWB3_9LAMI|nr:very-long-chain 3-oxoacyl-coa reductase 1 [Phtheirospermum japonicum]